MSPSADVPHTTGPDVLRRLLAVALAALTAAVLVVAAIAVWGVLDEKAQGGAPVFFAVALVVLGGLSMPAITLVHRVWLSGDARLRHETEQRVARQRDDFQTSREYERRRREQLAASRQTRQP